MRLLHLLNLIQNEFPPAETKVESYPLAVEI